MPDRLAKHQPMTIGDASQAEHPLELGDPVAQGVIGWSNGADLQVGTNSNNIYTNSDDVISWQ